MMITGSRAKIEGMAGVSSSTRRGRICSYMHAHAACTAVLWSTLCRSRHRMSHVQTQDVSHTDKGCVTYRQRVSQVQTHLTKVKAAHRRPDGHLSRYLTCSSDVSCYTMTAHLRCNIQGSAKFVKEALPIWAEVAGAKVNDLNDGVAFTAGEEDILRFEVSVGEALAVHEGQELHQATHQLCCFLFAVVLLCSTQNK